MKVKKYLIIGLIALMVFSLVGCGDNKDTGNSTTDDEQSKDLVIAGIYKAGDQAWFIDEGEASEEVVKEMGGKEFVYIDAKMDPDTYLQAIDNVIAQEVDGILTCIPDQQLSKATIDKIKEANIPVIAVDDPLEDENGEKLAPWVGLDAYKVGETNGEWMANYAVENGLDKDEESALLLLTMETVSSVLPRTEGAHDKFNDVIPDFPEDRVFTADYNGETDEGYTAASAIITANPQIKKWMIIPGNEEGGLGATRALEDLGVDKESCVIGVGGYLAKDEFTKEYSAMKAAAYFSADDIGGEAARLLMEYLIDGKEIPLETAVDAPVITKDNYKEVMGE